MIEINAAPFRYKKNDALWSLLVGAQEGGEGMPPFFCNTKKGGMLRIESFLFIYATRSLRFACYERARVCPNA